LETTPPVEAPRPPDDRARVPAWVVVLPIVALLATAVLWYRTDRELGRIRGMLAALDRTPTLDLAGAPTLGPPDARVVLVEFSDYECPFCIRHTQQTMPQLEANYIRTGRIGYAFRDFPIDQLHPQAIRAHEAGRCAADQNKFWELHKRLFSPAGTHSPEQLSALALEVGLNVPDFQSCLASGRHTADIRRTAGIADSLGASGTPAFFIGLRDPESGELKLVDGLSGAQPYQAFAQKLDAILSRVGR
jgi:protein-disulfide isomerase